MTHDLQGRVHHRDIDVDDGTRTCLIPARDHSSRRPLDVVGELRKGLVMECRLHHATLPSPDIAV